MVQYLVPALGIRSPKRFQEVRRQLVITQQGTGQYDRKHGFQIRPRGAGGCFPHALSQFERRPGPGTVP